MFAGVFIAFLSFFYDPNDRSGFGGKLALIVVLALVAAGTFWCAAVRAAPVIQEFPLPTANSGPASITGGPDGNRWFVRLAALEARER